MILKKITLHNYRQHKDLSVEFKGNLIVIVGRNGSGKSNFLGAIQFALTGEQPGFTKENLLTWGQESGYVELDFEHNGVAHKVQRRIEKPAATLTIGEEKITGTKKVQEALDEILGVDRDVLRQSVFVRQAQVDACLFDDTRTREQNFQKLLGLGDAAKHNKFLTDFLASVEKPMDVDEDIQRNKDLIAKAAEECEAARAKIRQTEETLASVPGGMESDEAERKAVYARKGELERMVKCHALVSEQSANFLDAVAKYGPAMGKPMPDTTNMLLNLQNFQNRRDNAVRRAEARKALAAAEKGIQDVRAVHEVTVSDIDNAKNEERKPVDSAMVLKGERDSLAKLAEVATEGNVCPLCGSTADHDIKGELLNRIRDLDARVEEYHVRYVKAHDARIALENERSAWVGRMERAQLAYNYAKSVYDSIPTDGGDEDVQALDAAITDLRARLTIANAEANEIQHATDIVTQAQNRLNTAKEVAVREGVQNPEAVDPEACAKELAELDARLRGIAEQAGRRAELEKALSEMRGSLRVCESGVEDHKAALKALLDRKDRAEEFRAKLKVVEQVKEWFGYRNGPRTMTQSVMGLLTDEVNKYLGQFGSPFTVVPMTADEGMGFRYVMTDGSFVPNPPPETTQLSGGQKVQLAVGFRFAVYTMFASKLGLLSLDEPTAYLDDDTIGRFGDMLNKIRDMAKNLNIQVLMATHETAVLGSADQTITIGA